MKPKVDITEKNIHNNRLIQNRILSEMKAQEVATEERRGLCACDKAALSPRRQMWLSPLISVVFRNFATCQLETP